MNIDVRKSLTQSDDPRNQRVTFNVDVADSSELRTIVTHHLPQWLDLFARKNAEYQDSNGTAFVLGERGQFSDMYRKMMKLKAALWDGNESQLVSEGVDEIIMDLIGHCFLTLEMRRRAIFGDSEILAAEEPLMMSESEFTTMVERAGLFVLPADAAEQDALPAQKDGRYAESAAEVTPTPDDPMVVTEKDKARVLEVMATDEHFWPLFGRPGKDPIAIGEKVRLKQHLGKGQALEVLMIEDRGGYDIMVGGLNSQQMWVHSAWVFKDGEKSPEELALEHSLAQRGAEWFGDHVNRDAD